MFSKHLNGIKGIRDPVKYCFRDKVRTCIVSTGAEFGSKCHLIQASSIKVKLNFLNIPNAYH